MFTGRRGIIITMERLGTKAETLKVLYRKLKYAEVLPQYTFTVEEWDKDKAAVIERFSKLAWKEKVIVRSSALNEDTLTSSMAGKFESVANVCGIQAFDEAVGRVIASYEDDNGANQILVQPMLEHVKVCGVAFTLEPSTLGNYYVINYDETGSTSAVTSGSGETSCLYYQFKDADLSLAPAKLSNLLATLKELETFFGQDNLDVEFAVTEDESLYILQVRALCVPNKRIDRERQEKELLRIVGKIKKNSRPKPFLCGEKAVYSVMTDWNPAEMIGIRPKRLALSLYQEIITDSVWAYQRDNYGYRNLRSFPLMVDFGGLPYIDVRVSFNSFIPAELDEEISEKLVNYYIGQLIQNPQKHDKAEFEIIFSCYTLDLPERIQVLKEHGFSDDEIGKILMALRNVTNHIIDHRNGLWRKDYAKIERLEKRYEEILAGDMEDIDKVYWLLEDCKRYGTLPFAGLARAAFIAVQILQSMVTCGILTKADYESFMNGVDTVSSHMKCDYAQLSRNAFLHKYGHLRPGTYDINSPRYDEAPELYFDWENQREKAGAAGEPFRMSIPQLNALRDKLQENGLVNDVLELFDFIKTVIEGREYGKFAFTRNLSKAIRMIGEIGEKEGISKADCANLDIRVIKELYVSTMDTGALFEHSIRQGKEDYEMTQVITLPPFIADERDVLRFFYPDSEPNFITSGRTCANVSVLEEGIGIDAKEITGKILLIPSADPGYDWIFSHGITGLITMYGGANSHMAIRAGELGIPAAVGVGTKAFERYKDAKMLEIDALAKTVRVLK